MSGAMEKNATIGAAMAGDRLAPIHDVNVDIYAVLGKSTMLVSQLLKIGRGVIIELEEKTTDPI
jgi:flagellar motor switch protein FliN/FliY